MFENSEIDTIKENGKFLNQFKDIMLNLPKSSEEFNKLFDLSNDELNIDNIGFEDKFDLNDLVSIPKNNDEFCKRFVCEW